MKDRFLKEVIHMEGGYVNDPSDSGGETNWGITAYVARKFGYLDAMSTMPKRVAEEIYVKQYWDKIQGDFLSEISPSLALEVADSAVNMGVGRASEFLQRCLNVFNNKGRIYSDIKVDGDIGPATMNALSEYELTRDVGELVKALNCLQGAFYIQLAERREKDERFVYGWLRNRVL